jgi:uncharacterized protein (TIGR02246 family)
MSYATTVGLITAALLAQGPSGTRQDLGDSTDAVELAKRETSAYVRAFNEHKAKELAAFFTRDADFAFLQGSDIARLEYGLVRGAGEIAGCLARFFDLYPDARLSQSVATVRLIRPDLLIADVDFEITGLPGDAGPIRGRSLVIRVKESGAWKIAADRNVSRTHAAK